MAQRPRPFLWQRVWRLLQLTGQLLQQEVQWCGICGKDPTADGASLSSCSCAGTERKVAVQLLVNLATEDQDAALAVSDALSPVWMTAVAAQLDGGSMLLLARSTSEA